MSFSTDTYIRRAERDDLDTILEWMEEPDFHFFLYGDEAQSSRQTREKIIMMLGRNAGNVMPAAVYLMIESKKHGLIGMVSLQNISWRNRSCNIDVYIGDKQKRNGTIITIAMLRIFEYCFDELNLHRISAFIYAFNTASWRILEKSGAVRELTLTHHILRDGQLYDAYGYGLLRREFDEVRKRFASAATQVSLQSMIEGMLEPGGSPK